VRQGNDLKLKRARECQRDGTRMGISGACDGRDIPDPRFGQVLGAGARAWTSEAS
jgi:hypothetical protein